jgi:four helix bundle protein
MKKYDLEERLIEFADMALTIVDELPNKYSSTHLGNQLARSGTAPALNYGEAQAAESSNDFIHKMKVCLKELRETSINLKIISKRRYITNIDFLEKTKKESIELVAIFTASINTAKSNKIKQ